jgi:uncharacterized protein YndB with AHSA1/START domain
MPYHFTLTAIIPAPAQAIYQAWLDSVAHSEMTGGKAVMSDEIGAEVSAWDGYISGRNLELVPGKRIMQSWRTTQFSNEHEDSIIAVTLEGVDGGTLLTLAHSNVPDEQTSYEQGGWQTHYFAPMIDYFAKQRRAQPGRTAQPAAPKAAAKSKRKRAMKNTKAKHQAKATATTAGRKKKVAIAAAKRGRKAKGKGRRTRPSR